MIYLYILASIWTLLAIWWTVFLLMDDPEGGVPSKVERLIQAFENAAEAGKDVAYRHRRHG